MTFTSEEPVCIADSARGHRNAIRPQLARSANRTVAVRTVAVMGFAVHCLAVLLLLSGCSSPPPLESEEAHSAADALYTAVTSRRLDLLDQVASHLSDLSASGKLSADALAPLNAMIEQARAGQWQAAAEDLDQFIRHQPPHNHAH